MDSKAKLEPFNLQHAGLKDNWTQAFALKKTVCLLTFWDIYSMVVS